MWIVFVCLIVISLHYYPMVCNPVITELIKLWFVQPASAGGRETAAIKVHPAFSLQPICLPLPVN